MKIVPLTCLYAGRQPLLLNKVQEIIRVHQNNDVAVAFGVAAARVLEAALLFPSTTSSFTDALDSCYDKLSDDIDMVLGPGKSSVKEMVLESYQRGKTEALSGTYKTLDELLLQLSHEKMKDTPDNPFYDLAARSCALPGAFTGPMYVFYKYATTSIDETVLVTAIRENILASGDTCSRAVFIGAVLSALTASPASSTPTLQSLMDKVESETMNQVNTYAEKIADKRPTDDATCSA
jgi:ADP-ribosylglycohydrolase